ncbi:MAG: NAD(P)/FAD-dependent oxidoreductase [Herminiimonas sp.]|nr:NAD(P)/FAD-dependent oxidoreductase [Herminiimonas sp.]
MSTQFDVAVIGAGAAGMMCAAVAAQRGRSVVLIDHATKLAEKIRISGGGRCNFTNVDTAPANFLSNNPHFCKSALSRYTPQDFLGLMKRHRIAYHEKHKGQLFCDRSAEDVIAMLKAECDTGHVQWRMPCKVAGVGKDDAGFRLDLELRADGSGGGETILAGSLVIASGGLSIPKIGATDFAYRIARQFGLKVVEPRPALVPLTFDDQAWAPFVPMAGIALEVDVETGSKQTRGHFREDLLFTHRGLSGPAVLQISSFWDPNTALTLNLLPQIDVAASLIKEKSSIRKNLGNHLAQWLPIRVVEGWLAANAFQADARPADMPDRELRRLGTSLNAWQLIPNGSEGYRKAEVTRGGVDTRALSQQTMMASTVPGLHFVGEAVDVTGWLGGYNFQWAWASGMACGLAA